MKTTTVNGHVLPLELVLMTESGRWGPSNRNMDLSVIPIEDKENLILLDVPEMVRNTEELRNSIARGDDALFALMDGCAPASGVLDVNQAVVIAITYGQEVLALDYSKGKMPRVVATKYEPTGIRWVEIAETFNDLLAILNLSTVE